MLSLFVVLLSLLSPPPPYQHQVEDSEDSSLPSVELLTRDKTDKDAANYKQLVEAIKGSKEGKSVGEFSEDKFPGEFIDGWRKIVDASSSELSKLNVRYDSDPGQIGNLSNN